MFDTLRCFRHVLTRHFGQRPQPRAQNLQFISDDCGPEDATGKFAEVLEKQIAALDQGTYPILETSAIKEFRKLHA